MPDRIRRAVIALGSFGACGVGAGRRAVARRRLCDHLAVSYDLPYGRANALKATSRPSESIRPCTTSTSPVASTSRRRLWSPVRPAPVAALARAERGREHAVVDGAAHQRGLRSLHLFPVSLSRAGEASAYAAEVAARLGLVCFDVQSCRLCW